MIARISLCLLLLTGLCATAQADESARAGELTLRSGASTESRAPLLDTRVAFKVAGLLARVSVTQRFSHPGDHWAEGVYRFPLPANAAVDFLRMKVGDRLILGEIQEREQARQTYRQAKQRGQRSALVEQQRPNLFTTSVANIAPGAEIEIEIRYQQPVTYDAGRFSLTFPMVVAPRYIPGTPLEGELTLRSGALGWSPATDQVPDAPLITPPTAGPGESLDRPVRISAELTTGIPIATLASPYHGIRVERPAPDRAHIELAEGPVQAQRDFELHWTLAPSPATRAALLTERFDGRDYGLLMLVPPSGGATTAAQPRELTLVLDVSGSMHGTSLAQAKASLERALERLTPEDRFNLITFNNRSQALFPRPMAADGVNLDRARRHLNALTANGGTEMASAIRLALGQPEDSARVGQVLFITDGAVGNEDALLELIRTGLGGRRLFTVGIGSAPNGFFIRKAAQLGRGAHTRVGAIGEVSEKMDALLDKLVSPQLTRIRLLAPGLEVYPAAIPDLYLGEPLAISLRGPTLPPKIEIDGQLGERPWHQTLNLTRGEDNPAIRVLWGRRKIEALMDRLRAAPHGPAREPLRRQVVETALEHHLVSAFTSLVAVDRTPTRPADAPLSTTALKNRLPEGWSHQAVFGFARTATGWPGWVLAGVLILVLGLYVQGRGEATWD